MTLVTCLNRRSRFILLWDGWELMPNLDTLLSLTEKFSGGEAITMRPEHCLNALAEPNRLRIFNLLMQGDTCNCELNDLLGLPPNLLSHHLRVLSEAGLVNSRRDVIDGRWIYYAVDRKAATRWQNWFNHFFDLGRLQQRPLCGPEGQQDLNIPMGERAAPLGPENAGPARSQSTQ